MWSGGGAARAISPDLSERVGSLGPSELESETSWEGQLPTQSHSVRSEEGQKNPEVEAQLGFRRKRRQRGGIFPRGAVVERQQEGRPEAASQVLDFAGSPGGI